MCGRIVCSHNETTVLTKEFEGDIIITDPCYICKYPDESTRPHYKDYITYNNAMDYPDWDGLFSEQHDKEHEKYWKADAKWKNSHKSGWELSDYGPNFEKLGIHNYITHSTLYGDWSCTTYNKDTKEPLGRFCADSGLVSVFLLDEVRNYNSEIDEWIQNHPWCVTTVSKFKGVVNFIRIYEDGIWTEDSDYWKKGDSWTNEILLVEGTGNINFTTRQTGL